MKRRKIDISLIDLFTVILYTIEEKKTINDKCVEEYCVVPCSNRQLITFQQNP